MLILTRRPGEEIVIKLHDGRRIHILITEVRSNGQVRIGFEADPNIAILRKELAERIDRGEP